MRQATGGKGKQGRHEVAAQNQGRESETGEENCSPGGLHKVDGTEK